MKTILNRITVFGMMLLMLAGCKKDEQQLVANEGVAPEFGTIPASIVLLEEQATTDSITFSWSEASYGYQAAVRYTLQFAASATDFEDAINVDLGNERSRTYAMADFNALVIRLGLEPESPGDVAYRVLAAISDNIAPVISTVKTITVTAYSTFREIPLLYVPGSHQGWSPETAPRLADVNFADIFEGYVYFPDASNEFKLTVVPCWCEADYGSPGGSQLTLGGGDNIKHSGAGFHRVTVNLKNLTWRADIMNWGVIGDATPGGWDSDQDMVYDIEEGVWKITVALSTGEFKFRANDDWGVNFGHHSDDDPFVLSYGTDNIPVAEAGTYDIVLDLKDPTKFVYSITKK